MLVDSAHAGSKPADTGRNSPGTGQLARWIAAAMCVLAASAQADTPDTTPSEEPLAEIIVTGSRISQRDFTANSPITTVSLQAIQSTGAVTLESALSTFPQFTVGSGPTTTGFFASGQATLNLRGLGSARNLVLLDGRRIQPSNAQQVVDINTIPKALIDSVEVITGGASAVYGSDAIAGVVNFKTRRSFEGAQLDVDASPTQHYGGTPRSVSLTAGGNFDQGRGNAVLSLSYTERGPIAFLDVPFYRKWPGAGDFRTWQGVYNPGANRPSQAALNGVFGAYAVAAPSPGSFIGINEDRTLFAASNGLANFRGGLGLSPSASRTSVAYTNIESTVQTPLKRHTAFARVRYDVTDSIETFLQAQFIDYNSLTVAEAGNRTLTIPVANPFIPAPLAALLASRANPTAGFSLEKRFNEAGPRVFDRDFQTVDVLAGVKGTLSSIDGSWELYATHGRTDVTQKNPGSVVASAQNALLNAADGGASLCAGGYNPFGLTTLSDACRTFLTREPLQNTELSQEVVEASVQGRLWTLPAGDLRFAAGVDHIENVPSTTRRMATFARAPSSASPSRARVPARRASPRPTSSSACRCCRACRLLTRSTPTSRTAARSTTSRAASTRTRRTSTGPSRRRCACAAATSAPCARRTSASCSRRRPRALPASARSRPAAAIPAPPTASLAPAPRPRKSRRCASRRASPAD